MSKENIVMQVINPANTFFCLNESTKLKPKYWIENKKNNHLLSRITQLQMSTKINLR